MDLIQLMGEHDWFYEYSDDHKAWLKGQSEWQTILNQLNECGLDKVLSLIFQFCPESVQQEVLRKCLTQGS